MRVNLSVKNIVIIVCAVIAAIVAAVVGAISVVKLVEKAMANTDGDYISAISSVSDTFTSLPVSIEEPDVPENGLVITSPSKLDTTVTYSKTVISGTSDSAYPVIMNGEELERGADGSFAKEVELNIGENKFIFEHKGKQTVCIIRYRYIVINSYSPSNRQKFSSGSTFVVSVSARPGSSVTATFNGKTINLSQETGNTDNEFVSFTGSFSLPSENDSDLNMGKVKFVGSYNGITETFNSGNIICLKNEYISNSPYIAEVVAFTAETFTGSTTDDYSDPRNNYLPKGTVDYCESGLIYDSKSGNQYAKLRCGRRVYLEKSTDDYSGKTAVVSRYRGTLPDHNELSVAEFNQSGRHTVIVLDSMWKAPFLLDIYPQQYSNPSKRDFTVSNATYEYVEISFCYATVFRGTIDIPVSNPVFSRAEIIPSSDKTILRLYLKSRGKFYGWDSYYNDNGQLCFEFLNPINTVSADNVYGVDLTGARVLIDAGHGGVQPGTVRGGTTEAERNLSLAYKVKSELESIGATVIMMRTGNYEVTSDERRQFLKEQRPDYCISIHHNAANSTAVSGFEVMHFNAFSSDAAKMMYRTAKSGVYSSTKLKWYYFFLMRITTCPVVLTENGYFTNDGDYNNIINEGQNAEKAKKIVQGIADYFISIQYVPISEPSTDTDLPSNPDNVTDSESSQPSVSEEYAD